jgi:two-component system sensor histidine kinase ChvG
VSIWGVQQRIGQVFQNLLANALSFSPENGTISIFVIPLKRRVSITIEDEGPGIPDAKLENIFERFYTERPGHEDFGQHSGLGLSICKHIIEAHGGHIFAENIKHPDGSVRGARFTVVLNKA